MSVSLSKTCGHALNPPFFSTSLWHLWITTSLFLLNLFFSTSLPWMQAAMAELRRAMLRMGRRQQQLLEEVLQREGAVAAAEWEAQERGEGSGPSGRHFDLEGGRGGAPGKSLESARENRDLPVSRRSCEPPAARGERLRPGGPLAPPRGRGGLPPRPRRGRRRQSPGQRQGYAPCPRLGPPTAGSPPGNAQQTGARELGPLSLHRRQGPRPRGGWRRRRPLSRGWAAALLNQCRKGAPNVWLRQDGRVSGSVGFGMHSNGCAVRVLHVSQEKRFSSSRLASIKEQACYRVSKELGTTVVRLARFAKMNARAKKALGYPGQPPKDGHGVGRGFHACRSRHAGAGCDVEPDSLAGVCQPWRPRVRGRFRPLADPLAAAATRTRGDARGRAPLRQGRRGAGRAPDGRGRGHILVSILEPGVSGWLLEGRGGSSHTQVQSAK